MIVTELYKGQGLGNQLFCYITTRVIGKDNGYKFGIDHPERFKGLDFFNLDFGEKVLGGKGPEGGPPIELPQGIYNYYREKRVDHPVHMSDIRQYDSELINILDNTKIDGLMQDEKYFSHRKEEIREWLKIKPEFECTDFASDDICIINFRGGDYVRNTKLFLPQSYWDNAVQNMRKINSNFKFVVITDDEKTAKRFFPDFEVHHFSIAKDYAVLKNAHYLIMSNSSFAWFPAWLSTNLKYCIAPKYWAAFNFSDGFWSMTSNLTSDWVYQDREGKLFDNSSCRKELDKYIENHKEYYLPKKITKNFLVISNFNNDISWVPELTSNYLIYDRSAKAEYPVTIDKTKIIRSPNLGYNSYDYFTYIIDNYDNLPEVVIFAKGHTFPRHVRREYFERVMNNRFFTPLEDYKLYKDQFPKSFISEEGGFCERNNSWYLQYTSTKYFHDFNNFWRFTFKDAPIPRYVRFAPGGDYIVPRENILKLPKVVYENLRLFMSHGPEPGETHIIERACHTLWTSNFELAETILKPVDESFVALPPNKPDIPFFKKVLLKIKYESIGIWNKYINPPKIVEEKFDIEKKKLYDEYRKKIKIYDVFTFFNELDLLEIRLNILNSYVDYFVIVEATETFSGKPKTLYFEENKERFKKWLPKIKHYVIKDTPKNENDKNCDQNILKLAKESPNVPKGVLHWLKEFYQKESIKKALIGLNDDDFCFISDVDEIWNPNILIDYSRDDVFRLRQMVYAYYMDNHSSEMWFGTIATKYKNIKNSVLNHLRTENQTRYTLLSKGGWHFTSLGGAQKIIEKIEATYSKDDYDTEEIKDNVERRIKNKEDYLGRNMKFWKYEEGLPEYIKENKNKYRKYFI